MATLEAQAEDGGARQAQGQRHTEGIGAKLCFARTYDDAHLGNHPGQTVTRLSLLLVATTGRPGEDTVNRFGLEVHVKGGAKPLRAIGECQSDAAGVLCGVECDGGGFLLKTRPQGRLLLDLRPMGYVRMTLGCGEDEDGAVELTTGVDDKTFLLSPANVSACEAFDGL